MGITRRLSKLIESLESALAATALISMILLSSTQVLLRNFWNTGLSWGNPIVQVLVVWVGFLGASMATHQRGHIRFDVLSKFLPERFRHLSLSIVHLASAVVCGFLTKATWIFLQNEKDFGSLIDNFLPTHWALSILPLSFVVMGLRFLMLSIEDIFHSFSPPTAKEAEKGAAQ